MEIRLPPLAEGTDSGMVVSVLVSVGDRIESGQTILELENQKAIAPIPSTASGKVKAIHIKPGDTVAVGQVLITLEEEPSSVSTPLASVPESQQVSPVPTFRPSDVRVKEPIGLPLASLPPEGIPIAAPPSLRKMAMQIGLDLTSIPGGYVTWEDVRRYVQSLQAQAASVGPKAQAPSASSKVDFAHWGPIRREKLSLVRRTIAQAMEDAWRTIPHVTQFHEADIGRALEWLKQHDAAYQQKGIRLTLTVLILKAVAGLLKKHPIFNASLDEATQEVIYKEYVHLGVAVDTEAGLMVPVLRDVDKKDVGTIALELHQLVEKARTRKVTLDELMGASFTVSNQGGIGGGHFTPIIHKPEAAILGVGRAVLRPVYLKEDELPSPRWMLPLALSYDHRLADGADAARFVRDLAQTLEHFGESVE